MGIKDKVNQWRRSVMNRLTEHIWHSFVNEINKKERIEFKRILISRPNNRLGNQLMITLLIQEVEQILPDCKIDLFVKGDYLL